LLSAVLWKDCLMSDPLADRDQLDAALGHAATGAREYLLRVRDERVLSPDIEVAIGRWSDPMPEEGDGTLVAVQELRRREATHRVARTVWATLRAYGRSGYRQMVERHLALAQHLAARIDDAPELERLANVPLNIVCFRARPQGLSESDLNWFNDRLGTAIRADGRVFVGTTTNAGKTGLRPAIVNWQTQTHDIDLLVSVTCELIDSELGRSH